MVGNGRETSGDTIKLGAAVAYWLERRIQDRNENSERDSIPAGGYSFKSLRFSVNR